MEVGNGSEFKNVRHMAAWLGLVPRHYSTGGKTTLLGISKRGNKRLRCLFVHGARRSYHDSKRMMGRLQIGSKN
jgi:transposase